MPDLRPDAQRIPEGRPVVLFILGFGRSGTSALTRVLSLCGATLPSKLLGATMDNPRGCWEPRAAIYLNEAILRSRGSSAYDLPLRAPADTHSADRDEVWIAKIRDYFATLPTAPLVVVKEPKITASSNLWFEGARLAGFDVAAVIALRHPTEAIASIANRAGRQYYVGSSAELGSAWWLKYTLLAERDTREVPRVVIDYANLLDDWRREVQRINTALATDLLRSEQHSAIDEFLSPGLRHHRQCGPIVEPFGTDWVRSTYEALSAAARDKPWDQTAIDCVIEQYQSAEQGFRVAAEGARRYRNLNRLAPALAVKVGLEVLALAHRRRGTWA
ncbi:sulfotransferase family protein [Mycobacterium sp. 236(2023)]|uniref:sulfotransferase family protein n=1 Tax=Mycobacterium sp. 236(2023) TaxID=3038163 RepID=UPI002414E379|nr:sulfotransferase family protein [Mycobacterium sp. 236(2023)]MDG4666791.1 sulfotransferase family protein [Mycobacterium sp. 236(2023)]